jgi:D-arabinose 1-dehydrogenase-like Zn-dependent alcohol dehydrogenase
MFKELSVKGSLVANKKLLDDMMRVVAAHDVKSLIHTVDLGDAPRLPEMYVQADLQGRLVVKM